MIPLHESRQGEISAYCLMVDRGKPAAVLPIKSAEIPAAYDWVTRVHNCKAYFEPLAPRWMSLWIYKRPFMLEVIRRAPQKPKGLLDHWYLGKLFGYSDEAIEEYLRLNGLDPLPVGAVTGRAGGKRISVIVKFGHLRASGLEALIRPLARFLSSLRHNTTSLAQIFVPIATTILQGGCDK